MTNQLEDIGNKIKGYLPAAQQIATVAATLAKLVPGVGTVVDYIELGIKVANGLANEIPQAVKVWNEVQAAVDGGKEVTSAEWAQWKSDIDKAHDEFLISAQRVANS